MFRGLANLNVVADDVADAISWYTEVFGAPPYFVMPPTGTTQYAEWRFGDDEDEFGVVSTAFRRRLDAPGGALVYLHVDDLQAAVDRLVTLGAAPADPIETRGEGFATASVSDPFGNLLGLMHSPHWAGRHS